MTKKNAHEWRPCPLGRHWVRTYPRHLKSGKITIVDGHCCDNRSKKDQIYSDELNLIADTFFDKLSGLPKSSSEWFPNSNKFDKYILGWCKYWNEIFNPETPLDADLIKALIASESSFKGQGYARGLMQITDATQKILCDEKGELSDHLINVNQKDLTNPNLNIAAGIRWLFRKKEIASSKLKREATWMETIMSYKGCRDINDNPMQKFLKLYKGLKNEKN